MRWGDPGSGLSSAVRKKVLQGGQFFLAVAGLAVKPKHPLGHSPLFGDHLLDPCAIAMMQRNTSWVVSPQKNVN